MPLCESSVQDNFVQDLLIRLPIPATLSSWRRRVDGRWGIFEGTHLCKPVRISNPPFLVSPYAGDSCRNLTGPENPENTIILGSTESYAVQQRE